MITCGDICGPENGGSSELAASSSASARTARPSRWSWRWGKCDPAIVTGFIRDITQRQKSEARLQELQSELVHVSRLTAMGQMASALAHELNQPLLAIVGYMKGSRRLLESGGEDRLGLLRDAVDKAGDQ